MFGGGGRVSRGVHHWTMLATAAQRFGNKPLVIAVERTLSFEQLDRLSSHFARQLCALGIRPGDRVTLWLEKGWRWMVAYYGILKIGAVVNPGNIQLTAEEIVFIVNDCEGKAIVAAQSKTAGLGTHLSGGAGANYRAACGGGHGGGRCDGR